ncbi:MAG: hypothetical protein R3C97_07755, partial [Geminicoccaceae bacterium]
MNASNLTPAVSNHSSVDANLPFEDRVPQGYYDRAMNARGIQSTWHRQKFERVREAMGKFERHLDIACGPGTFLSMLGGERSVGVDLATA